MAAGTNSKVMQQARRALEARKNEDINEWIRLSVPAVRERIKNAKDARAFLQGPEGESIARWNGIFATDILYEKRADGLFANVLYCVESQGESSHGDMYRYVQMLHADSSEEEWLYVQTVTASAEALANSSSRLRSTPADAERVYQERLAKKAKKASAVGERIKGITLTVTDNGSAAPSRTSSVSDMGATSDISGFSSDVDDDDEDVGLFTPDAMLSPRMQSSETLVSSDQYAQQRRTREAMEQVRNTLSGVLSMATMLGLSQDQFMACVHDVCTPNSPRLP